jgi:hypothetical protein
VAAGLPVTRGNVAGGRYALFSSSVLVAEVSDLQLTANSCSQDRRG